MASLASDFFQVLVDNFFFVERAFVAIFAVNSVVFIVCLNCQKRTRNLMIVSFVAFNTLHISAVDSHMNVNFFGCFVQRFFQIAVFYVVSSAAAVMASSAIITFRQTNALSDFIVIRRKEFLFAAFWRKCFFFGYRITCASRIFFISSRLVVANQAIDVFRVVKIEILIFPTVTGVTTRTTRFIRTNADTEIVNYICLP